MSYEQAWRKRERYVAEWEARRGKPFTAAQRKRVRRLGDQAVFAQTEEFVPHPLVETLLRWWFEYLGGAIAFASLTQNDDQVAPLQDPERLPRVLGLGSKFGWGDRVWTVTTTGLSEHGHVLFVDNGVDVVYLIQEECSVVGHGGTDNMLRYCLRVAAEDQGYIMPWDARAWS